MDIALVDFLVSKQIPCAPLYTVKDVVENGHIADARKMIREIKHPIAGQTKVIGSPIHLSETPPELFSAAPLLGEHTVDILRDVLGYPDEKIIYLTENRVVS